jgi:hypothetical protein
MQLELKQGRLHIDGEDRPLAAVAFGRSVGASMVPQPDAPTVSFFLNPADSGHKILVEITTTEAVAFASALLDIVRVSEDHWREKFGAF